MELTAPDRPLPELLLSELVTEHRRVIVTAPSHRLARHLFEEFVEHMGPHAATRDAVVRIRRAAGEERVEHPAGGWIRFGTDRTARWRGLSADTVIVAADVTDAHLAELVPCVLASQEPRVIRL